MDVKEIKSVEQMIQFAQKDGRVDAKFAAEQKANENVDITQNANWYEASGVKNAIKDMTNKRGHFLSLLNEGFEGDNLPDSYPLPYDTTDYFMKGKTAWTDEPRPAFDNQQVTDSKATLAQKELIIQFGITDKMIRHSTDRQIFDYIVGRASKAAASTIEGMIINGDTETGASGNVNSDDQAPATTFASTGGANDHRLLIDNGIRESAINNSKTVDVAAFDSDDIISVVQELGAQYKGKFSELALLADPTTYLKMQTDDSLKLAINTSRAAIDNGPNNNPFGINMIAHDLIGLTEADGKISGATPANNTKGQFLVVYRPAIRWGYGQNFNLEVERVQGYGFEITGTLEVAFAILDRTNTCAAGINITL